MLDKMSVSTNRVVEQVHLLNKEILKLGNNAHSPCTCEPGFDAPLREFYFDIC
jgi:hypothetical protein